MKKKPLQPPTLTAVLVEIASLDDVAFLKLKAETDGPNAFDSEKERIQTVAPLLGTDEDSVKFIMTALNYFYQQLHKETNNEVNVEETLEGFVDSVIDQDELEAEDIPSQDQRKIIVNRLSNLLQKRDSVDVFNKHERLRWGFLPAATTFSTFIDLRPNLSEDMTAIDELIPVIQCLIRTDAVDPAQKNFVFQMDPRSLKKLKDEIERAERKLSNIVNNDDLKKLMTKRRP
ncbi:hypothetical protein MKK75_05725 [Methylobacterium sp. J-030]|uniref:hypothetical protein n=1 Tax=Methylobacterium sp. J-030 TaxID=2836627 RepID=UPI001FBAD320|nr:hypothetical protein [Methylobacterium sp. J-030]MCJ2068311.1 hypothetical protein [Methylobacterium sp. J-030]